MTDLPPEIIRLSRECLIEALPNFDTEDVEVASDALMTELYEHGYITWRAGGSVTLELVRVFVKKTLESPQRDDLIEKIADWLQARYDPNYIEVKTTFQDDAYDLLVHLGMITRK